DLETFCVTAKVAPVIKKSVYWKTTEMTPGQVCYTGITNPKSRETYSRWLKAYREREKESLPPVFAVKDLLLIFITLAAIKNYTLHRL
ncbi:hypothetical protein scyTo_0018006, partial [Scyliorhinus torazame]|nr:hypothetical protein [Scyliorhinus torazame]